MFRYTIFDCNNAININCSWKVIYALQLPLHLAMGNMFRVMVGNEIRWQEIRTAVSRRSIVLKIQSCICRDHISETMNWLRTSHYRSNGVAIEKRLYQDAIVFILLINQFKIKRSMTTINNYHKVNVQWFFSKSQQRAIVNTCVSALIKVGTF